MAASISPFFSPSALPPVIFPCAGDGQFPGQFTPFVVAAGKATFAELCARPFGPSARLVFVFRRDQEEAHDVSARLQHMFPSRVALCVLPARTSGALETVQAAVRALALAGPFFVCDCDHSVDVSAMARLLPWSSVLVPTWPLRGQRPSAWGKARVDGSGRLVEVCEKEDMQGEGVLGRIGCLGFPDIRMLLQAGMPTSGGMGEALAHLLQHPQAFPGGALAVATQRAEFFGDAESLAAFQASRSTFLVDIDGTLVEAATDRLLPGAAERVREWRAAGHLVVLTTARRAVPPWLVEHDAVLPSLGPGPRVLVNAAMPQWPGGQMAQAFTVPGAQGLAALELEDHAYLERFITTGASSATVAVMRRGAEGRLVRKHAMGEAASTVLRRQAEDLERLYFLCPQLFPAVRSRHQTSSEFWYEMDYYEGHEELWHAPRGDIEAVVARVLAMLQRTVYVYAARIDGAAWVAELLAEKVLPRLAGSALACAPSITIDGEVHVGLCAQLALPLPVSVIPATRCPIHGDLTLENILYCAATGGVQIIDPAGARSMDAPELDMGKLFQSLLGDYERTKSAPELVREVAPLTFELPAGPRTLDPGKVAFLGEQHWQPGLFFMAVAFVRMIPYVSKVSPQRGVFSVLMATKAMTELHRASKGLP